MIVCGVDFETTGLEVEKHRVIEIGAVLWDTEKGIPIKLYSEFCYSEDLPEIDADAEAAHGISKTFLAQWAIDHRSAFRNLNELARLAQCYVGHNCMKFDKPFYEKECALNQVTKIEHDWIDTTCDLKYPRTIKTRTLVYLAAEHGFLNPFAHRAVFDVLTMLKVFQNYDPVAALAYAQEPLLVVKACVSFDDRQKAKDRGYRWLDGMWKKSLRASEVARERNEAGFLIVEVEE